MQQNEMINEFLDGGLMPAEEDNFLMMLATNDELKSEFKRALFIDNTLKEEAAAIGPSAKSTMQVFSALGITYSSINSDKTFFQKYSHLILLHFKKAAPVIITALIVSVAVSWYFMDTYNTNNGSVDNFKTNKLSESNGVISNSTSFPTMSSYLFEDKVEKEQMVKNQNSTIRQNKSIVTLHENDESVVQSTLEDSFNGKLSKSTFEKSEIVSQNSMLTQSFKINSAYTSTFPEVNMPLITSNDNEKLGFSVSFFGTEEKTIVKKVMYPETSHPVFARNGIEILYNLNEDFSFGVDLRQEYFFQDWRQYDDKHIWSQYYMHPILFTAGLTTKLNVARLFTNTKLITKLGIGHNEDGTVVRGMVGIDFDPSDDFGFTVGLENSNLFYTNEKVLSVTPKLGIVYSIKFNL